ncbi:MAG: FecR domain-containing protein [Candidatus Tectomicrobia bacterium]|uniref:FecR domain-containing protein n=1 Tax=Tectimicrobiota bacterium TaxID=2528274 RepID=A0A937W232_UNCTE|nr:FecR domain-containing protein [Candidatus Tectomicrobia bacterium]
MGWTGVTPGSQRQCWYKPALLVFLGLLQLSCAFATLENVVRQERPATPDEIQRLQIVRQGQRLSPQVPMTLQQGDEVTTDAETTVVINFATGTQVIIWPNSRVSLASIRAFLGELYVKARGLFRVETDYAVAGTEGTEFLTTVRGNNEVSVIVVDGAVRIESTRQRWDPVLLRRGEQALLRGPEAPQRQSVPQETLAALQRRVADMERLLPEAPAVEPLELPFRIFGPGPRVPARDRGGRRDGERRRDSEGRRDSGQGTSDKPSPDSRETVPTPRSSDPR